MDGWEKRHLRKLCRSAGWLGKYVDCSLLPAATVWSAGRKLCSSGRPLSLSLLENQRTRSDWKVQALIPQYLLPRRSHRQFSFIISLIFSDVSQIERINKHPSLESIDPRQLTRVCVQVTGHGKRLRRPLVQDDLIDRLFRRRGPPLY